MRASGRFPLTAVGDVNTYALFAELARTLLAPAGRAGIIVPTGIATDDTTKAFFGDLVETGSLARLIDFENEAFIFPAVHHAFKFCLLTMAGSAARVERADLAFFCRHYEDADDPRRRFTLSSADFALINPNTRTCPIFRTRADAELTAQDLPPRAGAGRRADRRRIPGACRFTAHVPHVQRQRPVPHRAGRRTCFRSTKPR